MSCSSTSVGQPLKETAPATGAAKTAGTSGRKASPPRPSLMARPDFSPLPAERRLTGEVVLPAERRVTGEVVLPAERRVTGEVVLPAERRVTGEVVLPAERRVTGESLTGEVVLPAERRVTGEVVREDALLVLFKAYKIFPCTSLQNLLGLGEVEGGVKELKRLLTVLAERDNKAAAVAIAAWDGEIAPLVIPFK
ncbi:hypothetical protein CYMTET_56191 [Cymbomonas tetramitiformis]|uniref:Uncharacterized protein n=1 Tax=Cymbomonas tetramitiformis TaxID=36881 RepID=A0AAE0EP06_9CHLO|nr:hypothetical protein CYMTET_56191 [Cymbomonas tetramitiformis]